MHLMHNFADRCQQTGAEERIYVGIRLDVRREVMFIVKKQVWLSSCVDAVRMLANCYSIGHGRRRGPFGVGRQRGGTKLPRAPTPIMGSGLAPGSSLVMTLTVLDAAGAELQIVVRRRSGKIEFWSPAGSFLAGFNRASLVAWLKDPGGQKVDFAVIFRSSVDGIVLDIPPLFVSRCLSQRDRIALLKFASAVDAWPRCLSAGLRQKCIDMSANRLRGGRHT
jgi:hypothetical protein